MYLLKFKTCLMACFTIHIIFAAINNIKKTVAYNQLNAIKIFSVWHFLHFMFNTQKNCNSLRMQYIIMLNNMNNKYHQSKCNSVQLFETEYSYSHYFFVVDISCLVTLSNGKKLNKISCWRPLDRDCMLKSEHPSLSIQISQHF